MTEHVELGVKSIEYPEEDAGHSLGALALLENARGGPELDVEQGRIDPMNNNTRQLTGLVVGLDNVSTEKHMSQSMAVAIFEQLVFPKYREARQSARSSYSAKQVEARIREIQLRMQGLSLGEIAKRTSVNSPAAVGINQKNFVRTLERAGFTPDYFQKLLVNISKEGKWQAMITASATQVQPQPIPHSLHPMPNVSVTKHRQVSSRPAKETALTSSPNDDKPHEPATRKVGKSSEASTDATKDFLKQIGKVALLTAAEEVELAKSIEAGLYAGKILEQALETSQRLPTQYRRDLRTIVREGERDKQRFIKANLRLVVSRAKRQTGRGIELLDLVQEGSLGAMHALELFDYNKGYKFSTYAQNWIDQAIIRAIENKGRAIRLPVRNVQLVNKLGRSKRELREQFEREPTVEELAKEMDITVDKVLDIQSYSRLPASLNQIVGVEEGMELGELVEDADAIKASELLMASEFREAMHRVLETLSIREAGVIKLKFGLTDGRLYSIEEIAGVYGVTVTQAQHLVRQSIAKLRHPSRSWLLGDYIDLLY